MAAGLSPSNAERAAEISDLYLPGTTLRLRRMVTNDTVILKLGQKVRRDPASPERVQVTNIYLSPGEYDALLALPGREISKTRYRTRLGNLPAVVDEFHGVHGGLVLAEVEIDETAQLRPLPPGAVSDVTNDDRYSGGSLAATSADQIRALLPPGSRR